MAGMLMYSKILNILSTYDMPTILIQICTALQLKVNIHSSLLETRNIYFSYLSAAQERSQTRKIKLINTLYNESKHNRR